MQRSINFKGEKCKKMNEIIKRKIFIKAVNMKPLITKIEMFILVILTIPIILMIIDSINIIRINNYSNIILDFSNINQDIMLLKTASNRIFSDFSEFNMAGKFNLTGENVYCIDDIYKDHDKKIAFLTFDDGPSSNTEVILDILNQKGVKATFFVLGVSVIDNPDLVLKIAQQGHGIGNHSYSHHLFYGGNFTPDAFLSDILRNDKELKNILGEEFKGNLFRFPGGNYYEIFPEKIPYHVKMIEAGFKDIDWNVDSMDASFISPNKEFILSKIKNQCENKKISVILMHDVSFKPGTVAALPDIIDYLKSIGFEFGIINSYQ